jgi:membrane protein required for colicin V production
VVLFTRATLRDRDRVEIHGREIPRGSLRRALSVFISALMVVFLGIFLIVLIVLMILIRILSHRIRNSALGPLDRSLGLVFGFLRGAVLVCVAWLIFAWLLPRQDHPEWVTEAKHRPLVERGSVLRVGLLPERLRGGPAATPGAAGSEAEQLRAIRKEYQNLLNPPTKGDAPENEPGYNTRMRDEMRRAIEGIGGSKEGAE